MTVILDMLKERMAWFGLIIHPEKSRIVYCRMDNEPIPEEVETSFVFLGYCFCPRLVKSADGVYFMGFNPAVSTEAARAFREKVRLVIRESTTTDFFHKGINYVNQKLVRWIRRCRKKARRSYCKAQLLLKRIALSNPKMFYQWQAGYRPM